MTQEERLLWLIQYLLKESHLSREVQIPNSNDEQERLLRSLMNIRAPKPVTEEFLQIQDAYFKNQLSKKSLTSIADLTPIEDNLYLWQGDITTLKVDAIVNAANSALLGCFIPCHRCIDNAIHSAAGVQLRWECHEIMQLQSHEEETGGTKVTSAYNLPSNYVIHTVGPIIMGEVTENDCEQLVSCYRSCLEAAKRYQMKSIAFCCISTGEYRFPNELAAEIAIHTVQEFFKNNDIEMEVVFNVFKEKDYEIYNRLLSSN